MHGISMSEDLTTTLRSIGTKQSSCGQTSADIVASNPRPYVFRGSLRRRSLALFRVGGARGANRQVCA